MNKYICILIISVLIASISQILLKISANISYDSRIKEYCNKYVITGYFLLFFSTILTILSLKGIEYKNVPIIETLGYIFVLILSRIILKEKINKRKLLGNLIIVVGIVVFYM